MKILSVIQHTSADYLGLMEDHLEGRKIRFNYTRPFTEDGKVPEREELADGLILLGGGPWGSAGGRDVPTLQDEIALTRAYLMHGLPVTGIGLGAQILALSADGKSEPGPYEFSGFRAKRTDPEGLNGFLPESWPNFVFMRDRIVPPSYAKILGEDERGEPALFQIGDNVFGFSGHPGFKLAMAEDLVMEFDEQPEMVGEPMQALRASKREIEDCLVLTMTGLIQKTGWMQP